MRAMVVVVLLLAGCATDYDRAMDALDHAAAMGLVAPAPRGPCVRVDPAGPPTVQMRSRVTQINRGC